MSVLMIYLALSAAAAAALGAASGQTGFPLVCLVVLFFVGAFLALLVLTVLFAAVCALFVDMVAPQKVPSRFYRALVSLVMAMLTTLSRIRLHVTGLEKLPEGCFLLVGNHRSSYDPIVTGWALRRRGLAFLSKPENMRIPVVGQLLHKSCYLAIDRENDRAAMRTILTASDMLARGATDAQPRAGAAALPQRRVQDCAEGARAHRRGGHPRHGRGAPPLPLARHGRLSGHLPGDGRRDRASDENK